MVKLNDGTQVPLETFITWHHLTQTAKTRSLEELKKLIDKLSETHKRVVNTPLGRFNSVKEAAERHKFGITKLRRLLQNTAISDFNYDKPRANDTRKQFHAPPIPQVEKVVTPLGKFITQRAAEKAHGFSSKQLTTLLRNDSENYYLIKDGPKPNTQKIPKPKWVRLSPDAYMESKKKGGQARRREVITPYGNFATSLIAAEYLGIKTQNVVRLIYNTAYPEYSYANTKFINQSKLHHKPNIKVPKLTITPLGTYKFKRGPQKAPDITPGELEILKENKPEDFHLTEDVSNLKLFPGNKIARQSTVYSQPKKGVVTPKGHFPSKIQAALAHNKSSKEFQKILDTKPDKYYIIKAAKKT
jgi:hypothetical protein